MPINVKGMLLYGLSDNEVMRDWLTSIKCEDYLRNFLDNGYDMPLLTRMTPQDLTAIGCKAPELRKRLLNEIKKLNIDDGIPTRRPQTLECWLDQLKLSEYYASLCKEGYNTIDKVCQLTWEDLEEIGIKKLGHQKRLLLGIERIMKFDKLQEERQNEYAIYDVHPNHRISLSQNPQQQIDNNKMNTISRSSVRSGFFQTRSGANLDHRGLPIATVMPALKHVNNSLANLDISLNTLENGKNGLQNTTSSNPPNQSYLEQANQIQPIYQISNLENPVNNINDFKSTTMKRTLPPLPPVRTNSLKMADGTYGQIGNSSIYSSGIVYGTAVSSHSNGSTNSVHISTGSTSFLRTPKLGTLTATTNKMLTSGGHIQTLGSGGTLPTARSIVPIREAPLPPPPQPPTILENIQEGTSLPMQNFSPVINDMRASILSSSLISHQLASADEFPPPPPPSQ